ncbi:MAG: sugar-binding protein [Terrimicrobiaceae bacterium]
MGQDAFGPDFVPPFEVKKGERKEGEVRVSSFLDAKANNQPAETATLVFGNKRFAVREGRDKRMETGSDNVISLFVNEVPAFEMILVGGYQDKANKAVPIFGGSPLEAPKFVSDAKAGTIRWSHHYPLPDGTKTEAFYQIKSLGDSRVEVSWDLGVTEEQMEKFRTESKELGNYSVYFEIKGDYRKDGLKIDGTAIEPKPLDELKAKEGEKQVIWEGTLNKLSFAPDKPLQGFTVQSQEGLSGSLREVSQHGRIDLGFMLTGKRPQNSVIFDLGEVAVPDKDAPPPIEGHDLWAQDALHIPQSPTHNLFANPSFDQGLRHWRFYTGGGKYYPSEVLRYDIDPENGFFGKQAMVINPVQAGAVDVMSFALPGEKGKTYTLSYYAKAETEGAGIKLLPVSSKEGGQFTRETLEQATYEKLGTDWQRISQTFVSDGAPVNFILRADEKQGRIWLDGMQFEAGTEPTAFVAPPLEGDFTTTHLQNNLEYGDPIEAKFVVRGEPGTQGKLFLELKDFYKKTVWSKSFDARAGETIPLPFDELKLATGVYFLKANFEVSGTMAYDQYSRFTIIDSLDGTHATKDLYGASSDARINRTVEELELMQRLGFVGSTSYGAGKLTSPMAYELRERFDIADYTHEVTICPHLTGDQRNQRHPDYLFMMSINPREWRTAEERKVIPEFESYSEEVLKRFEDLCEKMARECPYVRVWSIATEEEIVFPPLRDRRDFKEFAKLQEAFYRGIKRGNPKALALPSGGTSGYGKTRGREDTEAFLAATEGRVKWDGVAIHPYGSIDGTLGAGDLDESLQMLRDSIAKFGYGVETPMILNEGGGTSSNVWGDGPDYAYGGGQPSYDQGLHEFLHASKMARQFIICLKYWPQVPHFNTWQGDFARLVDYNLTPTSFLLGTNTLGHLLGEPKFIGDIRPAAGVRGYAFDDKTNGGVAAMWCTIDDVERGFVRGPVMRVRFEGELPELIDLMGRSYSLKAGPDGLVDIRLTPAPLFLKSKDPQALAKALQSAEILGAGSNVKVSYLPTQTGEIQAKVKNQTSREQTGDLEVAGKSVPFQVPASQEQNVKVTAGLETGFGKMFSWNKDYVVKQPDADPVSKPWKMDYFFVPKVSGVPDWSKVPSIPITNMFRPVVDMKQTAGGHPGDVAAKFQAAWDDENFYLRVEAEDDVLNPDEPKFWSSAQAQQESLFLLDGCLEVYFDCAANGRLGNEGFDLDDYRYDFSPDNPKGTSGPARAYRFYEVFKEYAGGVEFPTKEEAAKGIKSEFTRISPTKYAYTITFPRKYLAPMRLESGYTAGFGLFLHDRKDDGTLGEKGLSLATEPGAHCDRNPKVWPLMILGE